MSWFALAVIGHLSNGVAFLIDKILLRSKFSRSATYAGTVGLLSILVIPLLFFVPHWPSQLPWAWSVISGAAFVFALWAFFSALSQAEASRVVPIVGSLIPMMTLAGSFVFLGERLADRTFIGFLILILATAILSHEGKAKPSHEAVWLAVTAAFLFAISSLTAKATYEASGFLLGLILTRAAAGGTALIILWILDPMAGKEVRSLLKGGTRQKTNGVVILGQILGAIGFICVQGATAKGSPSIVNAMQALQYALLVCAALIFQREAPRLLGESVTHSSLLIKGIALGLTAVGMYFII